MQDFKPNKDVLTREYAKHWSEKMTNYCVNKVAAMATLPSGDIVVVDKQTIETRFCYDDSYDYEGAGRMAEHARTSTDYLKEQNMKALDGWLQDLDDDRWLLVISVNDSYGGDGHIKFLHFIKPWDLEDQRPAVRPVTDEEKQIIKELYQYARAKHEKKVDAYIKRYGTSKVHSWTYWGMA